MGNPDKKKLMSVRVEKPLIISIYAKDERVFIDFGGMAIEQLGLHPEHAREIAKQLQLRAAELEN